MQTVIDNARVPPGGYFKYKDPESGRVIMHPYLSSLENEVKKFRAANNFPLPHPFQAWFLDQVCQATPTCPCEDSIPVEPTAWKKARNFIGAMAKWAKSGFVLQPEDVIEERRYTCEQCSRWNPHGAFGFGKCGKCGCNGSLKTAIAEKGDCPLKKWKR